MIASDAGQPVAFRDQGDVFLPIRASWACPGLFLPVRHESRLLVDGGITMEIPALLARQLGATHASRFTCRRKRKRCRAQVSGRLASALSYTTFAAQ